MAGGMVPPEGAERPSMRQEAGRMAMKTWQPSTLAKKFNFTNTIKGA